MKIQTTLATSFLVLASFSFNANAAAPDLGDRVIIGISNVIAAQGNAALQEIQQKLKRDLSKSLRPLLPAPSTTEESASSSQDQTTTRRAN